MSKSFEDITKEEFQRYEKLRKSGKVNMFSCGVQDLARIDKDTQLCIIENYGELCRKWPDVRKLD